MRPARFLATLASIALAGGLLAAPSVLAQTGPAYDVPDSPMPRICQNEVNSVQRFKIDTSRLATQGILLLDGREVVVRGTEAEWTVPEEYGGTWANRFHSLAWLIIPALRGEPVVDLLLEREAALPDPGGRAAKDGLRATGWTEGAVRLRQGSANCLYAITQDPRLIPVIEGLVAANLDPLRYRGRPHSKPHNHGALANHVLLESARLLGRPEWSEQAFARFDADARSVFTSCGMTLEQSTSYHLLNISTWRRALREIAEAQSPAAQSAVERMHLAELAAVRLARPDGVLEAIGNGNPVDITDLIASVDDTSVDTRLWCGSRGWSANRTSWVDPIVQYTLRSGSATRMHGHSDHGSLTWWARGVPVLSDRGLFDKVRGPRFTWAQGMSAHSVFEPVGRSMRAESKARRLHEPGTDRYLVTTRANGVVRERTVTIPLTDSALLVRDVGRTRWDQQWYQNWQLSEGWEPVDGTSAWTPVAKHPSGQWLYVVCASGVYMRPQETVVETFPDWRTAEPAVALRCGGSGRQVSMSTLLVVSDIDGTLTWDHRGDDYEVVAPSPEPDPEEPPVADSPAT